MKYPKDLTTLQFGRLTVASFSFLDKYNRPHFLCICNCGNKINVSRNRLVTHKTNSCGCIRVENGIKHFTTHGLSKHRLNKIFRGMNQRCNNKNSDNYFNYGGRGIKNEWKTYEEFYNDMHITHDEHVKIHGLENTSIDRINVNGNYCKENCRWATNKEQSSNKRKRINKKDVLVSFRGEIKRISEFAKEMKIVPSVLISYIK